MELKITLLVCLLVGSMLPFSFVFWYLGRVLFGLDGIT